MLKLCSRSENTACRIQDKEKPKGVAMSQDGLSLSTPLFPGSQRMENSSVLVITHSFSATKPQFWHLSTCASIRKD